MKQVYAIFVCLSLGACPTLLLQRVGRKHTLPQPAGLPPQRQTKRRQVHLGLSRFFVPWLSYETMSRIVRRG
jgi:hypothetical protein